MFDQGPHAVLRRDGVCIVLKTPTDEMPQVEYWGADFGLSPDEAALTQLDAMTLRITPPNEKSDAALRPSLRHKAPKRSPAVRGLKPTVADARCSCAGLP